MRLTAISELRRDFKELQQLDFAETRANKAKRLIKGIFESYPSNVTKDDKQELTARIRKGLDLLLLHRIHSKNNAQSKFF